MKLTKTQRYSRRYYRANKERLKKLRKIYNKKNKQKISEYHVDYYLKNRSRILNHQKEYHVKNKKRILKREKEGYHKHIAVKKSIAVKNTKSRLSSIRKSNNKSKQKKRSIENV